MKSAVLTTAVGALLMGPSCYGRSSLSTTAPAEGTASAPRSDALPGNSSSALPTRATRPDSSIACETAPPGAELWRHALGEVDVSVWTSVAVDRIGNAFVASPALGTAKLDPRGTVEWSKSFGAVVAAGRNGHAYVTGTFVQSIALDDCTVMGTTARDIYLAELDENGGVVRCSSVGSVTDETLTGLAVDWDGNSIVSGPSLGTTKLDGNGRILWRQPLSGSVATDSRGNVVVTGALSGSAAFGDATLQSAGGDDVLVARLSPSGDYLFARRFGDAGVAQRGEGVAVDLSDDILVSGVSDGSVDFGGGPITADPTACPDEIWCKQAGFIAKFDSSGRHIWSRSRFPVRSLRGIATNSRDDVLVSGAFPGNAPPYRLPLLVELDDAGSDIARPFHTASPMTDSGAGYGVAFDRCDDVLWLVTAPTVPNETAQAFLAKLAP